MIPDYKDLSAFMTTTVIKNVKFKDVNDTDYKFTGEQFRIPVDLSKRIYELVSSADKMKALKASKELLFKDLVEFRNLLRAFGTESRAEMKNVNGSLSTLYLPQICFADDSTVEKVYELYGWEPKSVQFDFVARFGDSLVPISFNEKDEQWESHKLNGLEAFVLSFRLEGVKTGSGDITILVAEGAINGSNKASEKFTLRISVKKENKKELFTANQVLDAFTEGKTEKLKEMLSKPLGGGTFVHTFADDKFKFGRYPIIKLQTELRKNKDKSKAWTNYIFRVLDEQNNEVSVRINAVDQPMFNVLQNFYTVEHLEEGKVTSVDEINTDKNNVLDDFFGSSNEQFCIVYYGKQNKTRRDGAQLVNYSVGLITKEESNITEFQPLTDSEIAAYAKGFKPANQTVSVTNEKITGVTDMADLLEQFNEIPY